MKIITSPPTSDHSEFVAGMPGGWDRDGGTAQQLAIVSSPSSLNEVFPENDSDSPDSQRPVSSNPKVCGPSAAVRQKRLSAPLPRCPSSKGLGSL